MEKPKDAYLTDLEDTVKQMIERREDKKKIIELMIAAGSTLGVVTAFLHPNGDRILWFVVSISFFVVASLSAYVSVLKRELTSFSVEYRISVQFMLLGLGLLISQIVIVALDNANVTLNSAQFWEWMLVFAPVGILGVYSLIRVNQILMAP